MNTHIAFSKMHALGNDFMVINGVAQKIDLTRAQIVEFSDRRRGVGFDQLLLIESANTHDADFLYRIFNADGQEVGQCGNGARAVAQFIHDQKLSDKKSIVLKTKDTLVECVFNDAEKIKTNLGVPKFSAKDIPIHAVAKNFFYTLTNENENIQFFAVNIGNPHAIIFVEDLDVAPVDRIGSFLAKHPIFPESTNIEFVRVLDAHTIQLRVYERGVGETESCGSGACAAVIATKLYQVVQAPLNNRVEKIPDDGVCASEGIDVQMPGGVLHVVWQGIGQPVWLSGEVKTVFTGEI